MAVLAVSAGIVVGERRAFGDDAAESAMRCTFEQGHTWSYDAGVFTSQAPKSLIFDIRDIDLSAQSASLQMSGVAQGQLKVVRALNANSYLEVANEGFLNLTTVYDVDQATQRRPAVHSRHFGVLGQPVFAQYAGFCVDLDLAK